MTISTRMAHAIEICLISCLAVTGAFADIDPDEAATRYNEANAHYQNGDFAEGLRLYEELIDGGIGNPYLYYNASNASYRTGSLGKAILYIERAYRLAPSDQDIRANRAFLGGVKQDREPVDDNAVAAFLTGMYDGIPVSRAALWSGLMFAGAMLFGSVALFTGKWVRKVSMVMVIVGGLICVLSTGVFLHKVHRSSTLTEAVIMTDEANAYSGPGTENTHIFTIHEGTLVVIERIRGGWNLVRLGSGAGGWIQADTMESI